MFKITLFFAALAGVALVYLSLRVIKQRRRAKKLVFGQEDELLGRAMRAQGNFAEYTPVFLILMVLCETAGTWSWLLFLIGAVFAAGRAMHAYSLLKHEVPAIEESKSVGEIVRWRVRGMMATFNPILALSAIALYWAFVGLFVS